MKDELGDRIKSQYEDRARYYLPRRTFTIIRIDGKCFHSYTKDLDKPFDKGLIEDFAGAIKAILPQIQGAVFAYHQSDETSILLTDFADIGTCAWFDGNIQKITSISASLMTAEFNKLRALRFKNEVKAASFMGSFMPDETLEYAEYKPFKLATFDSRVFTIPDRTEVMNYFVWRNQDCARNSVSMLASSLFSHKSLENKSSALKQEMIFQKTGQNWADLPEEDKNGRIIVKEDYVDEKLMRPRSRWVCKPAWKFTSDKEKLLNMIPNYL